MASPDFPFDPEAVDMATVNPRAQDDNLTDVIDRRLSRREALQGLFATAAMVAVGGPLFTRTALAGPGASSLTFKETPNTILNDHHVAEGYRLQVVLRWGDPILKDAPTTLPWNLGPDTWRAQAAQFGYNNDYLAYLPFPRRSQKSDHGLLCVNHEYVNPELMWPREVLRYEGLAKARVDVEMAAHGHTVVEIQRGRHGWEVVRESEWNRRYTAHSPMDFSGPAAGHDELKTSYDPTGRRARGTLNNCAGGVTPWDTVLIAEENFNLYFDGDPTLTPFAEEHKRYGIGKGNYGWARFDNRFNIETEPHEPMRFGWMVEFDPYDPRSVPIKRTSLGRFKHEGAGCHVNKDGRVVVYSGDDQRFEYIYRFVSSRTWDPGSRERNLHLLDEGTLFVARFHDNGTLQWLPLVFGQGPLMPANGFRSQGDVLIHCRKAADLLGATPMDRPEEVEVNPVNGRVYVMLTNNSKRAPEQVNAANPRASNTHGHILELVPPNGDHASWEFTWNVFLLAGPPKDGGRYHPDISEHGWLTSPDNCAFDPQGRLWIATDSGGGTHGIPDGLWACDVEGQGRALTKLFYACPIGAECCGPSFTPDGTTLFVAVQHPGDTKGATFEEPGTRWPDFRAGVPPRPSVVAITKADGGPIGG